VLLTIAMLLAGSGAAHAAGSVRLVDPDAYSCSEGFVDFEDFDDQADLSAAQFPGIEFTTTGGFTWRVGDFATGGYNGKYPGGSYTSEGTHWAWLGESQGEGRIDMTIGRAREFSLLASAGTPVTLEAYSDGGRLLESAGPSPVTTNTPQMAELRIERPTADIGYVVVHDSGNFFLVDAICSDAQGVGDADRDGDGLSDEWEEHGADTDDDGSVDLDLPAMGADPDRKDLFVEIDWLTRDGRRVGPFTFGGFDARPSVAAAARVAAAFDNWPVPNPGAPQGINLHLDAGRDSIMDAASGTRWGSRSRANAIRNGARYPEWTSEWGQLDTFRQANVERPRRSVFHYVLYVDEIGCGGGGCTTGRSRGIPGHDLVVAKGDNGVETDLQEAVNLAHELGHNLGLGHGGRARTDDPDSQHVNNKANYLSIMNYWFSNTGLRTSGGIDGIIGYSPQELGVLQAASLDETGGLFPDPFAHLRAYYKCAGGGRSYAQAPMRFADGWGAIDWNCDGVIADGSSNGYLQNPCSFTRNGACVTGDTSRVLGSEDYTHLQFWGTGQGWDARNVAMASFDQEGTGEPTIEQAREDGVWWPSRSLVAQSNQEFTVYTGTGTVPVPLTLRNAGEAAFRVTPRLVLGGPAARLASTGARDLAPATAATVTIDADTARVRAGERREVTVEYVAEDGSVLGASQVTLNAVDGTPTESKCREARTARADAALAPGQAPAIDAFLRRCAGLPAPGGAPAAGGPPAAPAVTTGAPSARRALARALRRACRGRRIRALLRARMCRMRFEAPAAGRVAFRWALLPSRGSRRPRRVKVIARGSRVVSAPGRVAVAVRFTKRGRRLLSRQRPRARVALAASFVDRGGRVTRVRRTVTFRR
jgi:hypothetical protein